MTTRQLLFALWISLFALGSTAATAQEEEGFSLELFVGFDSFNSAFDNRDDITYGLRAGHFVSPRWGFEAAISEVDSEADIFFLDLSARFSLLHNGRHRLFLLGGAGVFRFEFDELSRGFTTEDLTLHVGLVYTYDLSERFYLRPQFLNRWINTDFGFDEFQEELSLGIGLRF